MKDDPNPYDSLVDAPISDGLTPRTLVERMLLIGVPFAAGAAFVGVVVCIIRQHWILAGVLFVVGTVLLWQGWRWSR